MKTSSRQIRLSALFLAFLFVLSLAAACGDTGASKIEEETSSPLSTEATAAETEPLDPLEARALVSDDVPELDFDGKSFRIFYQKRYTTDAVPFDGQENGEVLNDAVYRRNRSVEERFNTNIVGIEGEENAMVQTLMNAVTAGEDAYDLFMGHSLYSGKAALAGDFRSWYDLNYIDFEKPWFPQHAIKGLTINGRMYMTMSDMCLSFMANTYCMFFNKQLAENYGLDDFYQTVSDGKWTIDTLSETARKLYVDLNGNSAKDAEDQFGFSSDMNNHTTTWLFSCDIPTVEFHDDGTVTSVFNSERGQILVTKLRSLFKENEGSWCLEGGATEVFENGRILVFSNTLVLAEQRFRELEFDYGILPYPKFDEIQENYYTIPGGSVSCMAVPMTITDPDLVGAMTAALCRESWVSVMPTYYDIVLKVKGTRDETSIEMLDLIMDGRLVNATFLYDNWNGYAYRVSSLIKSNNDLASFTAQNDNAVIKHFGDVLAIFYDEG